MEIRDPSRTSILLYTQSLECDSRHIWKRHCFHICRSHSRVAPTEGRHAEAAIEHQHGLRRVPGQPRRHARARGRPGGQARDRCGGWARPAQGAPHRPWQAAAARPRHAPHRSRLAVSGAVAAGGVGHVRRRHPWRRPHHRRRPHLGARMRDCLQRRDHQGRHLLSADGEEASARAGNCDREPPAVPLSRR